VETAVTVKFPVVKCHEKLVTWWSRDRALDFHTKGLGFITSQISSTSFHMHSPFPTSHEVPYLRM